MAPWLQYLIGFAAIVVGLPVLAVAGKRLGSRTKGGLMLAALMGGFGEVLDPPVKRAVEETEHKTGSPETGEPPLPES